MCIGVSMLACALCSVTFMVRQTAAVSFTPKCSVQEHRPPGAPEQEIFEDGGQSQLWDHCDVVAHFPLDVSGVITSYA